MQLLHKQEMIESIRPYLAQETPFSGKSVLLFGHCNATEELADYLLEHGVEPVCFLDNSKEKQGGSYENIPIESPEHIQVYTAEDSIVLIASRYFSPMCAQIRRLGYVGDVVETVEYSFFQAFSEDEDTFLQKKERLLLGYQQLQVLREQWGSEHLVLCPHRALGDVYWAMSYLTPYLKRINKEECAVIVVGNPCREVVKLFGEEKIAVYDQKTMDALVQAVLFVQDENAIVAHHNHGYADPSFHILSGKFIHFSDFYRDVIFELPEHTKHCPPTHLTPFSNGEKMKKGKTVILAPYANSVVEAPLSFWENLSLEYQAKGFDVCTNLISGQAPVKGTLPLELTLGEMCQAVEWAGHFVSLRSGLCDVVHSAKAEKTVVFPDCYFSGTPHKIWEFFSLEGWKTVVLEDK